jgi:cation:H+ antiporter
LSGAAGASSSGRFAACAVLALAVGVIPPASPNSVLWTAPAILAAAMLIAWAAESAQFFIAQGFALAILAWLQTLPEFAVEAVLAWQQQVPLLMANLTGALRLLTGLGWPMIYGTAAVFHRRRYKRPLREIRLRDEHSVEVMGLLASMAWVAVVAWKRSLNLWDAAILIMVYAAYLALLQRMPSEGAEAMEDLEAVPRAIVTAPRGARIATITGLFVVGGGLIYLMAEPFLASLLALSAVVGVPNFVFVQWVAPFVSEFPEKVSAFYWARTVERASMALMNMVSSNINQWTLLTAMLPIVYSLSRGVPASIPLDGGQRMELLMTLGQSLVGTMFLVRMRLVWWQAAGLFLLWAAQFALSPSGLGRPFFVVAYFVWAAAEAGWILAGRGRAQAFRQFGAMWDRHLRAGAIK